MVFHVFDYYIFQKIWLSDFVLYLSVSASVLYKLSEIIQFNFADFQGKATTQAFMLYDKNDTIVVTSEVLKLLLHNHGVLTLISLGMRSMI